MPFKKKIKIETKAEPKVEAPIESNELKHARNRLADFTKKRNEALTPEKYKEYDFWVVHYKQEVARLSK